MQHRRYFPMTLIAIAMISGCSSMPNAALTEAHNHYNNARTDSAVTNLAPVELKAADDTLDKADDAFNRNQSDEQVNHLAYLANQRVGIAEQTAKRKTAEIAVTDAGAKRDQIRLQARTAEADAAEQQVAIAHAKADRQATELAIAGANSERDQALIAEQERRLKALNAKQTERGLVITLGDVLFSTDKSQLKSGGRRNVQKLANFLTQYQQYNVSVEGYTDSVGADNYNQELSDRRALAVKSALIHMAISSDRVTEQGFGEAYPVASNDNAAGRQLNRRVEIILSDNNGVVLPR